MNKETHRGQINLKNYTFKTITINISFMSPYKYWLTKTINFPQLLCWWLVGTLHRTKV